MTIDPSLVLRAPLLQGIGADDACRLLDLLDAREASYRKGALVLQEGEETEVFGMVSSGSLFIEQDDFWGNRNLINRILPGYVFAEAFALSRPHQALGVNVVAETDARVLWLDNRKLFQQEGGTVSPVWNRFIANLIHVLANRNLHFNEKVTHMARRTTREKLLSFLSSQAEKHHGPSFDIPLNRQELADYLGVERSAMSTELGKLRDEGLISFDKRHFVLKERS